MADVGVVKYKVELDDKDVGKQADKTQSTLTSKLGGAAKSIGAAALATSTAVAAAATAAVADLTKQAVAAYADFEQLQGGVETLFKGSADTVMQNASKAFQTAGLSANEYMETVTSFSASLLQSLGGDTEKAAEYADRALIDMSDNANKMGTDMELIQNAYNGFAKSNFTMLDNLKLGYGGTKEEMARLIEDASKMTDVQKELGITVDASSMSFGNIVNAISVMQESMGIAGTTAKEASTTISGSINMVKASWENVVTAIASGDSEQLTQTINDLVGSVETAAGNLLPVVETALTGIADLVATLAPQIAEKLPSMITDALPKLLDAGVQAIKALSDGLLSSIQSLVPTATQIVIELAQIIIQMAPDIVQTGCDLIVQLALGLAQALPELIPMAVDAVLTIVDTLLDNIDMLIDAAIQLIIALADGLIQALPRLIEKAPEIIIKLVEALVRNFPKIVGAGTDLVVKLIEGITKCWGQVISTGADIITQVKNGFSQKVQDALNWGRDLVSNFVQGIRNKFGDVKAALSDLGNLIADLIGFSEPEEGPLSNFHTFAPDMMDLYAKGIDDNIGVVEDSVTDVAKTIAGTFTADVGYNLPDISGYAADLSASMTATGTTEIIVPLTIDGREIARASAWYMNEQLAWEAR
jgi:phage-related protein